MPKIMDDHLAIALSASVPLYIMELESRGGPNDEDLSSLLDIALLLGEQGDKLLYRSDKHGETARIYNQTARAIAILAFAPGGITVFGQHWEAAKRS
jgi:hypothetical protein